MAATLSSSTVLPPHPPSVAHAKPPSADTPGKTPLAKANTPMLSASNKPSAPDSMLARVRPAAARLTATSPGLWLVPPPAAMPSSLLHDESMATTVSAKE